MVNPEIAEAGFKPILSALLVQVLSCGATPDHALA
jgi:hypothetical protein